MQEIRWKEPEIVGEIEKRRALEERPQRIRKELLRFFAIAVIVIISCFAVELLFRFLGWKSDSNSLFFVTLFFFMQWTDLPAAWTGNPHISSECRVNKLGVTHLAPVKNIAWRDIESYRFETDERAPNLRVLIVEARKRKEPLQLYYEGENLEARLRDAMAQGNATVQPSASALDEMPANAASTRESVRGVR